MIPRLSKYNKRIFQSNMKLYCNNIVTQKKNYELLDLRTPYMGILIWSRVLRNLNIRVQLLIIIYVIFYIINIQFSKHILCQLLNVTLFRSYLKYVKITLSN